MTDEQSAPEGTGLRQDDWKVDNLTQIAQQTVYNTYTGQTPPAADEKRHFFTVPFPRNADFVGREVDLELLHTTLNSGDPVGIHSASGQDLPGFPKPGRSDVPAGLTGQGGMGKTALAVEYCHRHRDDYPGGVFWVNAAESLAQGFAALGCVIDPANFDRPIPRQIDAAARYLNDHPDSLLVLDNVEDPASLARPVATGLIPTELICRVLFTTRRRDLPRRCRLVEVPVLPPEAALTLLLSQRAGAQALASPERAIAAEICAILGYLPLALEIAAAHMRRPRLSLVQYRDALLERGALAVVDDPKGKVSADDLTTRHIAAVAATLAEQWESLESDDARLLLRVAGQLPAAAQIPIARLGLLAGISDGEDIFGSPLELAVSELDNASFIEKLQVDELHLHPLVQEFAAVQTPNRERDEFRTACAENMHRAYSNFVTLEGHCARRGIDALEGDLRIGCDLLAASQSPIFRSLQSLKRILGQESHVLRNWESAQQPAFFAQQMHNRSLTTHNNRLTVETTERLSALARHYLHLTWRSNRTGSGTIRVLTGHGERVLSVAVTPDGSRVVSASYDRTLRVWNLESGAEERVLTGHEASVLSVTVTPDNRQAVSTSADGTVRIWDLDSGVQEQILTGHKASVLSVAVTPDGRHIVSASSDRTLRVWNLESGAEERVLMGHQSLVRSVSVTPDSSRAVSASDDQTLRVWDLETGAEERVLRGHESLVRSVTITPDGRCVVFASSDRTLRVWNLKSGLEERMLIGHRSSVRSVAVTPNGRYIVSTSDDHTVQVWDMESDSSQRVLSGHESSVLAVAITPNGRQAISASTDRTLRIWDLESTVQQQAPTGHESLVRSVAIASNGSRALSASDDHTLHVWNLESGAEEWILTGHEASVRSVGVTPDGRRAVSASADCTLRVWNLAYISHLGNRIERRGAMGGPNKVCFSGLSAQSS